MIKKPDFGLEDYPDHRQRIAEQSDNLGMEACRTHEERAAYIRRLVRGIFSSDLRGVQVVGGTQIVFGEKSLTPVPEWERVLNIWSDFPQDEIVHIIREERAVVKGEHLKVVDDSYEGEAAK